MNKDYLIKQIWPMLLFLVLFTLLFGFIYPGLITLINQFAFYDKSLGSLVKVNNEVRGSLLIGQPFSSPRYFLSRPSQTSPVPYNGDASNGSNLSPANPKLKAIIEKRIAKLKELDPENRNSIPIDMITASGSGLDPHISIANAEYQIPRIARMRNLDPIKIRVLLYSITEVRQFGILGEPRVNVLILNILLDKLSAENHGN